MVKFSVLEEAASPQHSYGLDFARKELEKHGWSEGKGLGKVESGRANAIKIGVKNNTLGVGFDVGKEFTNNWWDNLFNKAANNIVVEKSESGVQVSKKSTGSDITETRKLWKGKDLYHGRFVKANSGESSPSSSENPTVATTKYIFSDEELLKACGGRTAHKSARHGHKLNGKLKRVAEQDDRGHLEKPSRKRKRHSNGNIESTPDVMDGKPSHARNVLPHGDRSENIEEQTTSEYIESTLDVIDGKPGHARNVLSRGDHSENIEEQRTSGNETALSEQSNVKQKFDKDEILCSASEENSNVEKDLNALKSVKRKKRQKKETKLAKKHKHVQNCELVNGQPCKSENEGGRCKNELHGDVSGNVNFMKDASHKKTIVRTKKRKKKKKKME